MKHYRFTKTEGLLTPVADIGFARVVQLSLAAGRALEKHRVETGLLLFVMNGKIMFEADGQELTMGTGEMAALDPGVPHRVEAREDAVLALVLIPS